MRESSCSASGGLNSRAVLRSRVTEVKDIQYAYAL